MRRKAITTHLGHIDITAGMAGMDTVEEDMDGMDGAAEDMGKEARGGIHERT